MQTHLLRQWLRLAVAAVAVFFAACGDSDGDAATARVESCELERSSIVGGQIASGEETASLRVIVEVSGSGQLNYTATITSGDWLSLSARDFFGRRAAAARDGRQRREPAVLLLQGQRLGAKPHSDFHDRFRRRFGTLRLRADAAGAQCDRQSLRHAETVA